MQRSSGPCEPMRGPLELRVAVTEFATEKTPARFDRQADEVVKDAVARSGSAPLVEILEHWHHALKVGRQEIAPIRRGDTREETIRAWEAAHPGEKLHAVTDQWSTAEGETRTREEPAAGAIRARESAARAGSSSGVWLGGGYRFDRSCPTVRGT